MKSKKAHYGYYGLPILSIMIGIIFLIGILILLYVSKLFGWLIVSFGLYVLGTYGISIMWVQHKGTGDFPDILKIKGNERVLDVGCGLGRTSLGHANIGITLDTYGHLLPGMGRTAAERFDKFLKPWLSEENVGK